MNDISTIPATVAAEISGVGSFFGSCQIAASNFESILNSATEASASPEILLFAQNSEKNEVLMQLQEILGEDAGLEAFERIIKLLEKGSFSVQVNTIDWEKSDLEDLTLSLLERLNIAIKQMTKISGEGQMYENEDGSDREKFLNLLTDLLKTGIITPQEYETALKEPEKSRLPLILINLERDTRGLLAKFEAKSVELPLKSEVVQGVEIEEIEKIEKESKYETHMEWDIENFAYFRFLMAEMEIEPEDGAKFESLIHNLLENGLISSQDLKEAIKPVEAEPSPVREFFEELWENVKGKNETETVNLLSKIKDIAEKDTSGENLLSILKQVADFSQNSEHSLLNKIDAVKNRQGEEKQVQPEVRAVWEGEGLKIEVVNPKTGEKLQTTQTAMPQNMQERIQEFEIVKQIVAKARFITTPTGEQKIFMHLKPDHLGSIDMRISLNNGEMQIQARVDTQEARQALENHIGFLREGLEKQGINLDRLEVSVEQRERQDAWSLAEKQEQHEQRQKNRRHRRGREMHLAVSVAKDANADTGRRLGYNTMEYLA